MQPPLGVGDEVARRACSTVLVDVISRWSSVSARTNWSCSGSSPTIQIGKIALKTDGATP
ncbi:MAG: hypothetical protein ACR2F6_02060 [Mycobacteriales bacterium]